MDGILEITLRMYVAMGEQLAKLQLVDALRELVPYSQAVSHMMIVEAYFRGHESGSRYAWGRADKPGKPPGYVKASWEANENVDPAMDKDRDDFEGTIAQYGGFLPEVLDRMECTAVSRAFSMWAGFSAFCDECVGVGAEKVGAVVMEPVIGRIQDIKTRAERLGLEADPETAEEIRENLSQTWRMVEERAI